MGNGEEGAAHSALAVELTPDQRFQLEVGGVHIDWFLQDLVRLVDMRPVHFGITLHAEGLVITGQLIGAGEYLQKWTTTFLGMMDEGDLKEEVRKLFQDHVDAFDPAADGPGPQMIHLREARIFAPGQLPLPDKGEGSLWRGRLSAVSGFTLGTLTRGG